MGGRKSGSEVVSFETASETPKGFSDMFVIWHIDVFELPCAIFHLLTDIKRCDGGIAVYNSLHNSVC